MTCSALQFKIKSFFQFVTNVTPLFILIKHNETCFEHCGVEESVEHVICVCQKYTNEREIMKNELRKMGMDELKLKNIVTRG